jgi:exopolysaccharide production protein ExoY
MSCRWECFPCCWPACGLPLLQRAMSLFGKKFEPRIAGGWPGAVGSDGEGVPEAGGIKPEVRIHRGLAALLRDHNKPCGAPPWPNLVRKGTPPPATFGEPHWSYPAGPDSDIFPLPRQLTVTQQSLKRSMDIVGALGFFLLLGPLYLLVAAVVLIGMGRPVHYSQTRLGQDGRPFRCYKFRSMPRGANEILRRHLEQDAAARTRWEQFQKLENDPRISPVGRAIRRLSLDELPQFYNVLKGDMSLVGPRPCMVRQRTLYGDAWPCYCQMRPGITGLWQVSGRNRLTYAERVALDARYAAQWSLRLDARILARTFWVVLSGDGSF